MNFQMFKLVFEKAEEPEDVGSLISGSSTFSTKQLEHLEVHGSRIAEAWLGKF